jgi:hypothetical protein
MGVWLVTARLKSCPDTKTMVVEEAMVVDEAIADGTGG